MCDRTYSLDTEPNVWTYADNWCQGYGWQLPVGSSSGTFPGGTYTFGNDMISSLVVPPGKIAVMDGMHTYPPGSYPAAWANDFYSSANVIKTQDWSDTVLDCCNKTKKQGECPGLPYGPVKACNPIMMKYCSRNPDIANSDICAEWYLENPTFKAQIAEMVCSNPANIEHSKCLDWCRQNPGKCDISAKDFCEKHPEDPFCNCITSPVTKYNPACVDAQCIGSGYTTASMKSMSCPNIVDCSTQIELQTGGRTTTGNITAVQNCGSTEQQPTSSPTPTSGGTNNMMIFILIFILIIIVAGFVVVYRQFSVLANQKR